MESVVRGTSFRRVPVPVSFPAWGRKSVARNRVWRAFSAAAPLRKIEDITHLPDSVFPRYEGVRQFIDSFLFSIFFFQWFSLVSRHVVRILTCGRFVNSIAGE